MCPTFMFGGGTWSLEKPLRVMALNTRVPGGPGGNAKADQDLL